MGFLEGVLTKVLTSFANRIADEVILVIRKRTRMMELDKAAITIKDELSSAESAAEREAILDKVHDLINDIGSI
ncbi:MAG: hypothetical protein GY861_17815 [bacterium]|nr:hypothetical protein [bacterium]